MRVTPDAERQIRSGHPWLFGESIRSQNRSGILGELAVIYDRRNRFLAVGLYDPESPIRVRVLHHGKPERIDSSWWNRRLEAALARRNGLFDANTDGYRWIHGESDGWPGLVLDRYGETLVVKLYTATWLPRLVEIIRLIEAALYPRQIALRMSRNAQATAKRDFQLIDGQWITSPADELTPRASDSGSDVSRIVTKTPPEIFAPKQDLVRFLESGLRFEADVLRGQKTGFFLDQRENRRVVESLARGRSVLNAFSFSGGFSLYAVRGGAREITDLDISRQALESGRRNFELNRAVRAIAECRRATIQADAFEWLRQSRPARFDLIILDPPSLAKRESEKATALRAYSKLMEGALTCLRAGGIVVASSCSAHVSAPEFFQAVRLAASRSRRAFLELRTTRHPLDHPATFAEAEYLKCIYLRF